MSWLLATFVLITFNDCSGHRIGGWYPVQTRIVKHEFIIQQPIAPKGACNYEIWFPNGIEAEALLHGPKLPIPERLR